MKEDITNAVLEKLYKVKEQMVKSTLTKAEINYNTNRLENVRMTKKEHGIL